MPDVPRPRKPAGEPMPYGQRYALLRLAGEHVPDAIPGAQTWKALERRGLAVAAPRTRYGYELTDAGRRALPEIRESLAPRRRQGGRR